MTPANQWKDIPGERQPPQAIEAEKWLLGAMMLSEEVIGDAIEIIRESDFYHPPHRALWRLIVSMWTNRRPIDLVTLPAAAESAGLIAAVGGAAYIVDIFTVVNAANNWRHYAEIIRESSIARQVIEVGMKLTEAAYNPAERVNLAEYAEGALIQIAGFSESKAETKHISDILARRLDYYEKLATSGSVIEGLTTGIDPLDRAIRGLRAGNMIVIAAATKAGKTSLALNIMTHVALSGHSVGIFSLEMNEGELADRLIAAHAEIDLSVITRSGLSWSERDRLMDAVGILSKTGIFVRDESVLAPLQFRAAARKLVVQHKCKLLIVDYAQLMEPASRDDNRERQVAECSRTIKTTAAELEIPIIVLSQLNEQGRSRESRTLEQDANIFAVIEEIEFEHYLNIKYARDCARTKIPLTFRKEYTRFVAGHGAI